MGLIITAEIDKNTGGLLKSYIKMFFFGGEPYLFMHRVDARTTTSNFLVEKASAKDETLCEAE